MSYAFKSLGKIVPHRTIETKSYGSDYTSTINTMINVGMNPYAAYLYLIIFYQCAPIYDAITRITDEAKCIHPYIFDVKKEEYTDQDPLLTLLHKPNMIQTYAEFVEEACQYYKITGNNYFIVTAKNENAEPYEIYNASPEYMTITGSNPVKYPDSYVYSQFSWADGTFRPVEINRQLRYFTQDRTKELIHWKHPNLLKSVSMYYGRSPLSADWLEIQEYIKATNHNLSMLIRGVTSAGIFMVDGRMSADQRAYLREQLDLFHAGANNAGRTIVLEQGQKFEQTTFSNRDMDYEKMQERVTKLLYMTNKIPLPIISAESMTYNNREVANLDLYDNAVMPLIRILFDKLHQYLMPRYRQKDSNNFKLEYEESKVPALAVRRYETLLRQRKLGIFSINELRQEIKYENAVGGSGVYAENGSFPVAQVPDGSADQEPLTQDFDNDNDTVEEEKKLSFFHAGKNMKNPDGTNAFSFEELKKIWLP